jgi:hypothetical protein
MSVKLMKRRTMTSRLLFMLAALSPSFPLFAHPDTLFVTHSATTYLLFASEVTLVDIGQKGEYVSSIEGKCVFVKAAKDGAAPTSILVQHGNEYFVALLAYKKLSSHFLYDYRKKASPEIALQKESKHDETVDIEKVRQHFISFQNLPQGIRRKRTGKDHLQLSLTHLANDKGATYLNFTLRNGSTIDYQIDMVSFERSEKRGKRFSSNNVNLEFVEPILCSSTQAIEAKCKEALQFAIPLYALRARSHMIVTLREKNGSRMLSLKIPARYINRAGVFQPSHL